MSRYRTTMKDLLEKVYKEDGHQDVSSSKRMCRTIVEDAQQIESKLNSMSPEDSLDTWWTNKLAVSANNLNKARDYIVNDVKEELQEVSLKNKLKVLDRKIKKLKDKAFKKTMSTIKSPLFASEELDMTNEEIEIEEGKMKTIATMFDQGKSASEIAKALKLPVSTVKSILGEETELDEFTTNQINTLKKSYSGLKGMKIAPDKAISLSKALDKLDLLSLRQLNKEKIPFISTLARNKIYKKTGKFEELDLEESAAAAEIQRTNTRRDSMDYGMYKKAVELLRTKQYAKLGKHIYDAETAPREYVMGVLDKKEPSTFKKIFGNQSGYYSLMKPKLKEDTLGESYTAAMVFKAKDIARKMSGNYSGAIKEIEKIYKGLQYHPDVKKALMKANEQVEQIEKEQPEKEKKESDNKDSVIAALKDQISMLKQKLENEKNKAIKPEPNPDTGEVPLTIGLANKLLKDKEMKKEDVQEADLSKPQIKKVHKMADELPKKDFKDRYGKEKGDAVRYATATNIVKKKLGIEENQADMMFKKLSQRAQTYVNELLRSGMGTMEAIAKAKEKFKESDMNESKEQKLRNMKK